MFKMFRKHQKKLIVIFGVLLMLSFTVFGSVGVVTQMQSCGGGSGDPAVATYKDGQITERQIRAMSVARHVVNDFIDQIVPEQVYTAVDQFARNMAEEQLMTNPLFRFQVQRNPDLRDVFIEQFAQQVKQDRLQIRAMMQAVLQTSLPPLDAGTPAIVQTYLLSEKAEELGVLVSDDAIADYLNRLTQANPQNPPEMDYYRSLYERHAGRRLSWRSFVEQMRRELLAISVQKMAGFENFTVSRFDLSNNPEVAPDVLVPDRYAELRDRYQHKVRADVMEFKVADYLDQVTGAPSPQEAEAIYEDGKNRFAVSGDPRPGFQRRLRIVLEYFEGKLEDFIAAEMANVTDEEVKKHYEENIDEYSEPAMGPQAGGSQATLIPKPLEEVEEEIRKELAEEPAREKLDRAINRAQAKVNEYGKSHINWEAELEEDSDAPKPRMPDWNAVAKKEGLTYHKTDGLVAPQDIADLPFSASAFDPDPRPWLPKTNDKSQDVRYAYWKSRQEEEHVPKMEEVRDEIAQVWRHRQALALAKKEAEAVAAKARKSKSPLKDQFGERVTRTNEFSWYEFDQRQSMAGIQPRLQESNIEGVDRPGEEFRRTVSELDVNEVGVAANQPKTAVYVIRIVYETRAKEERIQDLLGSGPPNDVIGQLASIEASQSYNDWLESVLEKDMQLQWVQGEESTE